MQDIRIGYRVTTPDGVDGSVVSIRRTPHGNLVGVRRDRSGKITHHYGDRLKDAHTGANVTYADVALTTRGTA